MHYYSFIYPRPLPPGMMLCLGCVSAFMSSSSLIEFCKVDTDDDESVLYQTLRQGGRRLTVEERTDAGLSESASHMPPGHMTVYAALAWLETSSRNCVVINHSVAPMFAVTINASGELSCPLHLGR